MSAAVMRSRGTWPVLGTLLAAALLAPLAASAQGPAASAPSAAKKELVARILKGQQGEFERIARGFVERPAVQMLQDAGLFIQRQVPADKRDAVGRQVETEVKKFVDEAYPLVRERALRLAPSTIGAGLEDKMSEDELRQLANWVESPAYRKYQQLEPEVRNAFLGKLLADSRAAVDPKLVALEGRVRAALGAPPQGPGGIAPNGAAPPRPGPTPGRPTAPAAPAPRASGN